jgi:hypothetical protein
VSRAIAILLIMAGAAHADRAAQIARALAAVRGLGDAGRAALDRGVYDETRARCHTDTAAPTAACSIDAARAACATAADRASCLAAADVIATDLRGVADFVDDATRARLALGGTDYHAALAAELHARYALLAAELAVAPDAREADAIDTLCATRDRAPHACAPGDVACIPSLAWSRCVAALVWYVGGAP